MAGCVVGYLRAYRRWDGSRGLTFAAQRALIRAIARKRDYGRSGRLFLKEDANGEANGWPVLRRAIRMAEDNADRDVLVVIPTLDGVQFNRSFLELLVGGDGPVYVCSGWRRPTRVDRKEDRERRSLSLGWLLSLTEEAAGFARMVARVRQRARVLGAAVRAGLGAAKARGVRLGARRRGAYRLTKADRKRGGQATARSRRTAANEPYLVPLTVIDVTLRTESSEGIASSQPAGLPAEWEDSCPISYPTITPKESRVPVHRARFRAAPTRPSFLVGHLLAA